MGSRSGEGGGTNTSAHSFLPRRLLPFYSICVCTGRILKNQQRIIVIVNKYIKHGFFNTKDSSFIFIFRSFTCVVLSYSQNHAHIHLSSF